MKHLTSEQIEAMLSGAQVASAAEHVRNCAACAEEVTSLRGVLSELHVSATAVAARERMVALPRVVSPRVVSRNAPRMAWAMAAMVVFVGISAPLMRVKPVVKPAPVVAASTMSDEALLNSIQNDLSSSVPESLLPLSSASTNAAQATTDGGKQ